MPCCMCEKYKWDDPQEVVYKDPDGKEYCLFHAPAEHKYERLGGKKVDVDDFNAQVSERIQATIDLEDDKPGCEFSGTIFPGKICFDKACELPPMSFCFCVFVDGISFRKTCIMGDAFFDGASIQGDAFFGEACIGGKASFYKASIVRGALFEKIHIGRDAFFHKAYIGQRVSFNSACIGGEVRFAEANIRGTTEFYRARIMGGASFVKASIEEDANFAEASIQRGTSFCEASIKGGVSFREVRIKGSAHFREASIGRDADFGKVSIGGFAVFSKASIKGDASFREVRIKGSADFNETSIGRDADFGEASIGFHADFSKASIGGDANFGECSIDGDVGFVNTSFGREANFDKFRFGKNVNFEEANLGRGASFVAISAEPDSILRFQECNIASRTITFKDCDPTCLDLTQQDDLTRFRFIKSPWTKNGRIKACTEDQQDELEPTRDFYQRMKAKYKDENNEYEASKWHIAEKEAQLKILAQSKGEGFNWFMLWLYKLVSGFGENPGRAFGVLACLFIVPFLFYGMDIEANFFGLIFHSHQVAEPMVQWLKFIPLTRAVTGGEPGYMRALMFFWQLLITLQAALFAFALRNNFRR